MQNRSLGLAVVSLLASCSLLACAAGDTGEAAPTEDTATLHDAVLETPQGALRIKYAVVDGEAIWDDDVVLGPVADLLAEGKLRPESAGIADGSRRFNAGALWPNEVVRYRFAASISAAKRQQVLDAIAHYHQRTSLVFSDVGAAATGDVITFRDDLSKCNSQLGRKGGNQDINVGGSWCGFGSTVHEIGHALGLIHEHQRTDRNAWVKVDESNATNWDVKNASTRLTDYDLGSIMHYGTAQGKITRTDGTSITANRTALSDADIRGIAILYGSELEPTTSPVSWGQNRLDTFVRGGDGAVYHKAWDGSGWSASWERLGGYVLGAPEAVSWGTNRIDLFARGQDRALYHKAWAGASWWPGGPGWENLGGKFAAHPSAVSWGANRLDVFGKGDDGAVYHKSWNGSSWSGYESLGGYTTGQVKAVSWGPNRIDLFCVGTDHALFHKAWNGNAWWPSQSGWERLGGIVRGRIAATSWGPNRLDVFVKGQDGSLFHKAWGGAAWYPSVEGWESLGGKMIGNPEVASWGPNRLDVFVQGMDGALFHKAWNGAAWYPSPQVFERLGGGLIGSPAPVAWGPNRLDVFVRGMDTATFHKAWNGASWYPSTSGYETLGGGAFF